MSKKTPKPSTYLICGVLMLLMAGAYLGFVLGMLLISGLLWGIVWRALIMLPLLFVGTMIGAWYIQLSTE